jgi:hypothetical protein
MGDKMIGKIGDYTLQDRITEVNRLMSMNPIELLVHIACADVEAEYRKQREIRYKQCAGNTTHPMGGRITRGIRL